MQTLRHALTAYGQAADTLPPLQQVVMLYDGAIRRVREARAAIEERRAGERYTAVSKATAIVEALQSCLDHEQGGEIAARLERLYTYFSFRLGALNLEPDVAVCDELIARLGDLRHAWAMLLNQEQGGTTSDARGTSAPAPLAAAPGGVLVST